MEKRKIRSLDVSVAGLGCNNFGWRIDEKTAAAVVDAAIDAGVNFFDTADLYDTGRSEEFLGRALGGRRDSVIIASKFGYKLDEERQGGAKPEYVRRSLEGSLRRLGTDRIDLYQLHFPDAKTPIEDTLGAMEDLVSAGKVREIGCSNFSAAQLRQASGRFASVQNHYNLVNREPEAEAIPECVRQGIAFIPYYPLANGLLTGKYRRGQPHPAGSRAEAGWGPKVFTDRNLALAEALAQFAESRGHTLLELAVSWLAAQPAVVSVIAGATSPAQVRQNAAAAGWKLTGAELGEVDAILARA